MLIVNLFHHLARTHKVMRGFRYDRIAKKGAGTDMYPLTWLDDPVLCTAGGQQLNVLTYTVNVDILAIPDEGNGVEGIQQAAILAGLEYRERIDDMLGYEVEDFSFITLRDYTDDDAAGARFTFRMIGANFVDLCAEPFDENKHFTEVHRLPQFSTNDASGCAIFNDKPGLPNFKL